MRMKPFRKIPEGLCVDYVKLHIIIKDSDRSPEALYAPFHDQLQSGQVALEEKAAIRNQAGGIIEEGVHVSTTVFPGPCRGIAPPECRIEDTPPAALTGKRTDLLCGSNSPQRRVLSVTEVTAMSSSPPCLTSVTGISNLSLGIPTGM